MRTSKIQSLQSLFSLLFPSHTHVLAGRPHQPHRCRERLAVVFGVCWKRSTGKNRLSARPSWQTGTQISCHSTSSCGRLRPNRNTFTTNASTSRSLTALVRWLSNMAKRQAGTWMHRACTVRAHTPTDASRRTRPAFSYLNLWTEQLQAGLFKHCNATASSYSAASESACL